MSDDSAGLRLIGGDHDGADLITRRKGTVGRYCRHQRVELDMDAKRVYCGDCKAEVPAFDALNMLAGEIERWERAREAATRDARQAVSRLEELKREERNAKARLRRLRSGEAA